MNSHGLLFQPNIQKNWVKNGIMYSTIYTDIITNRSSMKVYTCSTNYILRGRTASMYAWEIIERQSATILGHVLHLYIQYSHTYILCINVIKSRWRQVPKQYTNLHIIIGISHQKCQTYSTQPLTATQYSTAVASCLLLQHVTIRDAAYR